MKKFIQEFKEFAISGNLIDMAVGVIVGGAFNKIVGSLVEDIFTPLIAMILGSDVDFSDILIGQIKIGNFINTVVTFFLTALCLFVVIKAINKAKKTFNNPAEEVPAAPAGPTQEELLTEIRDLLAKKK